MKKRNKRLSVVAAMAKRHPRKQKFRDRRLRRERELENKEISSWET